ncbi:hypothetical protein ISCGN_010860 [Ixodes scapularis]
MDAEETAHTEVSAEVSTVDSTSHVEAASRIEKCEDRSGSSRPATKERVSNVVITNSFSALDPEDHAEEPMNSEEEAWMKPEVRPASAAAAGPRGNMMAPPKSHAFDVTVAAGTPVDAIIAAAAAIDCDSLRRVWRIFDAYAAISGAALNFNKCHGISLGQVSLWPSEITRKPTVNILGIWFNANGEMPFVKWTVEPVFISRQPIPPDKNVTDELEASANITLVGTLRQLACLVSVADCIFEGISAECRLIQERSEALRNKLQRCERTVSELNAKAVRIRYAGDDRVSGQELWCGATLSGTQGCANVTELSAVAVANLMNGRVGPQLTIGGLTPRDFEKV